MIINKLPVFKHLRRKPNPSIHTRPLLMLVALSLCSLPAMGQASGSAAFSQATTLIKTYQEPVKQLMFAIAAVIAIVGAFNVFFKMQNGDQDVKKTIMLTFGGCIAFVILAVALPAFFT